MKITIESDSPISSIHIELVGGEQIVTTTHTDTSTHVPVSSKETKEAFDFSTATKSEAPVVQAVSAADLVKTLDLPETSRAPSVADGMGSETF